MYRTRRHSSGFTLVEILIVVIILGILAAIVIPQFTNASQDARKNSLTSQLQTVRSQLSLASLQHRDITSPDLVAGGTTSWDQMTEKTDDSWATGTATATLGSYFNSPPTNPLNGGTLVLANTSATADPDLSTGAVASGAGSNSNVGWIYYTKTGKVYATTKNFDLLYDETGTNDNSSN